MVVPMEIKTVAVADRLLDGGVEEENSPIDRNEKIQLSTLPDPTPPPENLPQEIDATRDDDINKSIANTNCHDGDRLPTCCFDIDISVCDRGIDKLLCKTDDFLYVDKLAEYLCGTERDPCFDVDCNTNCGDLIMKDADYGDDDDTAFHFNVQCGKLGDAGIEIKQQEIENKEEEDVIAENPIDGKVVDGTANISTDEVTGNERAPPKEGEDDIVRLQREIEALEIEKERADEAAAVAAAAAAAAAKSSNLKKEQPTNQDERIAWLKTEFERLEQEYAAEKMN